MLVSDHLNLPVGMGSVIVNGKGIPGTLGCIAYSNSCSRYVLLTNYHTLFGNNAGAGADIWLQSCTEGQLHYYRIGKSLAGKSGIFQNGRQTAFIDAALGVFSDPFVQYAAFVHTQNSMLITGAAEAETGESVTKTGGGTKTTTGIISSTDHHDVCNINGTVYQARNQILVKPCGDQTFSGKGDSGSVVMNSRREVIGLLWGATEKGEGIACPIRPVMEQLDICFDKPGKRISRVTTSITANK